MSETPRTDALQDLWWGAGGDMLSSSEWAIEALKLCRELEEEGRWIRRKVQIPPDTPMFSGMGRTLAGAMHVCWANSQSYLNYIYTYKCNDKQGIIANLTRALAPFAEGRPTGESFDYAKEIIRLIPFDDSWPWPTSRSMTVPWNRRIGGKRRLETTAQQLQQKHARRHGKEDRRWTASVT